MSGTDAALIGLGVLVSYLLGAVPFGLLAGFLKGIDIRQAGSGNIGATNATRVLGKPVGITVHVIDIGKGFVASFLVAHLFAGSDADLIQPLGIAYGCAAIVGHVWPVYLRFHGGKGMAASFGVFLGLAWLPTIIAMLLWLAVKFATRYVSLASIAAVVSIPITMATVPDPLTGDLVWRHAGLITFGILVALLVLARHKSNIRRLLTGAENKVGKRDD